MVNFDHNPSKYIYIYFESFNTNTCVQINSSKYLHNFIEHCLENFCMLSAFLNL